MEKLKIGDKVKIQNCMEADGNEDKILTVAGNPRDLCGSEVVALDNEDGSRFSSSFCAEFMVKVDV